MVLELVYLCFGVGVSGLDGSSPSFSFVFDKVEEVSWELLLWLEG